MTIFAVSDLWLDALYEEALNYNFTLQGYGNFSDAIDAITYVNQFDIIGFLCFMENYDQTFFKFLDILNLIVKSKTVLLYSPITIDYSRYNNIRFKVISREPIITDIVVNRYMFGTLLLDVFKPYELYEENDILGDLTTKTFRCTPFISKNITDIFEKVVYDESVDAVCARLKNRNELLYDMRVLYVRGLFSNKFDSELSNSIKKRIDCISDSFMYCNLNTAYNLILEEIKCL